MNVVWALPIQAQKRRANGALAQRLQLIASGQPLIEEPVGDAGVAVDAAVAEERPVAANIFELLQVALADEDLFLIMRGFDNDTAEGIAEE